MHFFDFLQLEENEQIELLWYNGEHIATRKDGEFMMLLYQVEAFYVEVHYQTKERKITKYLCFECTDLLEPYLKIIDLSPLYKFLNKKAKTWELQSSQTKPTNSFSHLAKNQGNNKKLSLFMSGILSALFPKKDQ
ncbi:MAG: hypothetical protein NVS9B7_10190 [Flavisolibacter sp.]